MLGGVFLSQVRFDDLWVTADLLREALGDLHPVIAHQNSGGNIRDHPHLVLNQANRDASFCNPKKKAHEFSGLLGDQAAGRFIQ